MRGVPSFLVSVVYLVDDILFSKFGISQVSSSSLGRDEVPQGMTRPAASQQKSRPSVGGGCQVPLKSYDWPKGKPLKTYFCQPQLFRDTHSGPYSGRFALSSAEKASETFLKIRKHIGRFARCYDLAIWVVVSFWPTRTKMRIHWGGGWEDGR